jgi:hypothetical protein
MEEEDGAKGVQAKALEEAAFIQWDVGEGVISREQAGIFCLRTTGLNKPGEGG